MKRLSNRESWKVVLFCSNSIRESQRGDGTSLILRRGTRPHSVAGAASAQRLYVPNWAVFLRQTQGVSGVCMKCAGQDAMGGWRCWGGTRWHLLLGRRLPHSRLPGRIQPGLSSALVNATLSLMPHQAPLCSSQLRAFAFSLMQAATPESVLHREKAPYLIDQRVQQDPCALSDCHEKLRLL